MFDHGSSKSTSSGSGASARASATRCCCPPESSCGYRLLEAGEPDVLHELAQAGAAGGARDAEADVLRHRQVREERVVLEHHADAPLLRRHPCAVRQPGARQRRRCRSRASRTRRSAAAAWSFRSRRGRAGRRSRHVRRRATRRPRLESSRTASTRPPYGPSSTSCKADLTAAGTERDTAERRSMVA